MSSLDVVTMGRCSIDLYSNDVGAPFAQVSSFGAFVGGCPTNIAVGTRRLGLKSGLVTGLGDDPVADFVTRFLEQEGVDTRGVKRLKGFRSTAVLLGIEPPDKFPLVFYRERAPDLELGIDDVLAAPLAGAKALLLTGTGLSKDPSRSATFFAAEHARKLGVPVYLDVDFRADQWHDVRAFGVAVRALLPLVDVVIGTETELNAALMTDASSLTVAHHAISAAEVTGDALAAVKTVLARGPQAVALKLGAHGSQVFLRDGTSEKAAPFKVQVANVLGAGDAFASGFLYGRLKGFGWGKSGRFGNATGAIVVTRQACANAMPTEREALDFVAANGGF